MLIGREEILTLIPHQLGMCLLDGVDAWDAKTIRCGSNSHRDPANPLRREGRLSALHLAEYGAQAMAVHGGLLARGRGSRAAPGFLASIRDLKLAVEHLDDMGAALVIEAEMLMGGDAGWQYRFSAAAGGRELGSGRVAVVLLGAEAA